MKKSFTLVELLIVLIIIGIVTTLAIPQYQNIVEKSRASEAWANMGLIRKAEELYYAEHGEYRYTFYHGDPTSSYKTQVLNERLNLDIKDGMFCHYHVHTYPPSERPAHAPPNAKYAVHCERTGHDRDTWCGGENLVGTPGYWAELVMYDDGTIYTGAYEGF